MTTHRHRLGRWMIYLGFGFALVCLMQVGSATAQVAPERVLERWQNEVDRFATIDADQPPREGGIVFFGSSSIRMWDLKRWFPDRAFINRGFGGSNTTDAIILFERLVLPHRPRVIVFYEGDNDIGQGRTPAEVAADFASFAALVERHLPETQIVFLSIKPSESRWNQVATQRDANRRIEAFCAAHPHLRYVDVAACLLGTDGKPDASLFKEDRLHLSDEGYEIWTRRVNEVLREVDSRGGGQAGESTGTPE